MTARETQRSITPGSVPHGERQSLEQGISEVVGGEPGGGGVPGGGGAPSSPALPDRGNPLSDLLSGAVQPGQSGPISDGLPHGPGEGPATEPGAFDNDLGTKLQMVARHASSPVLRRLAVDRLRRMYRENG